MTTETNHTPKSYPTLAQIIHVSQVESVYSGRPGCCCGCRGTHSYPKSEAALAESRGGKVNDANVTRIFNKIMQSPPTSIKDEGSHLFLDLGSRWYILYKKPLN